MTCDDKARNYIVQEKAETFCMKQKRSLSGNDFVVKDLQGKKFVVFEGKAMSLRDKTKILDADGKVICVMAKKLATVTPTFKIKTPDEETELAVIRKRVVQIGGKLRIDLIDPRNDDQVIYTAESNMNRSKTVVKNTDDQVVAKIGQSLWTCKSKTLDDRDVYGISVAPGMDAVIILCFCAARDEIIEQENDDD